jgi:hypothetical protein
LIISDPTGRIRDLILKGFIVNREQVDGAMSLESPLTPAIYVPYPSFDLLFWAFGVTAVIGHIQNTAGLEFGKDGRIFFDHNEHGTGFVAPNLELIYRVRLIYSELNAVISPGFH